MTLETVLARRAFGMRGPSLMIGDGFSDDGEILAGVERKWRMPGQLFLTDATTAAELVRIGHATRIADTAVQRMAQTVLAAETPLGAALAALRAGVATWHAEQDGAGHWRPVRVSGGAMRDPFDARFRDEAEAAALWANQPEAVPLLSIRTEHGIRRAYIWHPHYLLEIATQVFTSKG